MQVATTNMAMVEVAKRLIARRLKHIEACHNALIVARELVEDKSLVYGSVLNQLCSLSNDFCGHPQFHATLTETWRMIGAYEKLLDAFDEITCESSLLDWISPGNREPILNFLGSLSLKLFIQRAEFLNRSRIVFCTINGSYLYSPAPAVPRRFSVAATSSDYDLTSSTGCIRRSRRSVRASVVTARSGTMMRDSVPCALFYIAAHAS